MFDHKTLDYLQGYVYALIDPRNEQIFYIGKGHGNRVFDHAKCAIQNPTNSDKLMKIREILDDGQQIKHIIIRHGLTDEIAYEVEAALIDLANYLKYDLSNQIGGHRSFEFGLMTTDEIIRKINAEPLKTLSDPVIIININKTYKRGSGQDGIYQATKESWVISKSRRDTIHYALSEYRGLIVEVFKIVNWYSVAATDKYGKAKTRWGFNGEIADENIRDKYINKSISHIKMQGATNPIRYRL